MTIPERQSAIVQYALAQEGKPYFIGTDGPDSFDCNGLIERAWMCGGAYPWATRHAASEYATLRRVEFADRQPGDVVCFGDEDGCHHVVLVVDANRLIGANHGTPKQDGETDAAYVTRMAGQDDGRGARVCVVPPTYWTSHRLCIVRPPALIAMV